MTDEDSNLLSQIAAGSETAMSKFYDKFHSVVYSFALKRMREPSDAAEVLNVVMMEVWKTAGRFQGRSKVRTWLLGITNFKIIDSIRKIGRHEGDELSDEVADHDSESAIDAIILSENAEFVKLCVGKLSDNHKQVVHLAFFEDCSYSEISQVIDCPEGTIKTRMFHAKSALKKCLKKLLSE